MSFWDRIILLGLHFPTWVRMGLCWEFVILCDLNYLCMSYLFAGNLWHILYLKSPLAIMNGTITAHVSFFLTMLSLPLAVESISAQYARYPPDTKRQPGIPLFSSVRWVAGGTVLFLDSRKEQCMCTLSLVATASAPVTAWVRDQFVWWLQYPLL